MNTKAIQFLILIVISIALSPAQASKKLSDVEFYG